MLKKRVEALKFSASETPEKWSYKMQLLLNMWKRIPADKRGGTIADLSDTLLDKVLEVPSCKSYTQYVALCDPARHDDGPAGSAVRPQGRAWRAGEAAP